MDINRISSESEKDLTPGLCAYWENFEHKFVTEFCDGKEFDGAGIQKVPPVHCSTLSHKLIALQALLLKVFPHPDSELLGRSPM